MINLERVGKSTGTMIHEYGTRDVILYHLGIGASAADLDLVYEKAAGGLKVCPTFAVVTLMEPLMKVLPEFNVSLRDVLHGEQTIFLTRPIPPEGMFLTTAVVPAVYDKGKAALLILETASTDKNGRLLFRTRVSIFCRGLGGFGGDPGPKAGNLQVPAGRKPDFEISRQTGENQAALYRLSGDWNPLHIDPMAASFAGFPRPILHGLCTFGFAGRAVLQGACGNEVGRFKEFGVRFSNTVFPGDTITTRGWRMEGNMCRLQVSTGNGEVLSNAYARVDEG